MPTVEVSYFCIFWLQLQMYIQPLFYALVAFKKECVKVKIKFTLEQATK